MKNYSHSIQGKIIVGFLIIILMIIGMFCIVLYEWNQSQNLKKSVSEINSEYKNLNKIYLCIISLTTKGESVIAWDDSDYNKYHKLRINADSVLSEIKLKYSVHAHRNSIDSLRVLLERKEMHLRKIMKAVQCWEKSDSLLSNELPTVAKRTVGMKTITRKKKGIAGLFGKKDTIQIPYITNEIQDFNKKLSSVRNVKTYLMETSLDSLRLQNRLLNQKLYDFVYYLDNQIQQIFIARNLEIRESQQETFKLFSIMICFTVFLIIISFLIIRSDLYKEEKIKLKLKQSILENEDLLEMRKKIILTISHDIRGPIGNINNCADLVSDTREKKKREIYLNDIRYSCQHVLHLVNNLMDAYRINEAGDLHNCK